LVAAVGLLRRRLLISIARRWGGSWLVVTGVVLRRILEAGILLLRRRAAISSMLVTRTGVSGHVYRRKNLDRGRVEGGEERCCLGRRSGLGGPLSSGRELGVGLAGLSGNGSYEGRGRCEGFIDA
jgi:hypothetical protein